MREGSPYASMDAKENAMVAKMRSKPGLMDICDNCQSETPCTRFDITGDFDRM